MALVLTQLLIEMSTRNISWWIKTAGVNLITFMCRLSWNLGASTSWNPQGLSRPVMELLYCTYTCEHKHFPPTPTLRIPSQLQEFDQSLFCIIWV
jgi:hypothetical protein